MAYLKLKIEWIINEIYILTSIFSVWQLILWIIGFCFIVRLQTNSSKLLSIGLSNSSSTLVIRILWETLLIMKGSKQKWQNETYS